MTTASDAANIIATPGPANTAMATDDHAAMATDGHEPGSGPSASFALTGRST